MLVYSFRRLASGTVPRVVQPSAIRRVLIKGARQRHEVDLRSSLEAPLTLMAFSMVIVAQAHVKASLDFWPMPCRSAINVRHLNRHSSAARYTTMVRPHPIPVRR
jgi:hypothetical protein